jgi:cardiolipin synthase
VLTYANQLTILRMIFIPCFVLLLVYGFPRGALLLFILAGVTDALDGFLARKLQQRTVLGSFLDPMADKLLITSAFVTLSIPSLPLAAHIPIWLTVTAISRDLLIALASLIIHLQTGHKDFPPSFVGKCTTTAQLFAVGVALLVNLFPMVEVVFRPLVFLALFLTIVSGLHYFYSSVKLIESYQKAGPAHGDKGTSHS